MVFILETYPLQICLLLGLWIVSVILVPIWLWLPAIRHLRARFLGENRSAKALISAIFLLTLPSLAVWESFTISITAQHAPCRLVYSSNMDAPLPSSVLLAINEQGSGTPALAVVRARDGATQWGQHNSSTSFFWAI
jgi:hypothetical protein